MQDKLAKLQKVLEIASRDTISASEVEKFLTMVLEVIKKEKETIINLTEENSQKISDAITQIDDKIIESSAKIITQNGLTKDEIQNCIQSAKDLLVEVKNIKSTPGKDGQNGLNGIDGIDGINGLNGLDGKDGKDGVAGQNGSPDTPVEVRDKLQTLTKDDRLDVSAIKGVNKKIQDTAIGILDQRTQYLINKTVKHDATLTGSGTDADPLSAVGGVAVWGGITGKITSQTDLIALLPTSGSYTPTLITSTNVNGCTLFLARWTRIGDVVTVSGGATINDGSSPFDITIDLPVATAAFSNFYELSGSFSQNNDDKHYGGIVQATVGSPYAIMSMFDSNSGADMNYSYHFQYNIIP